ncbi:TPA: endonuclease III [Candidatus Woesearchaeota archaeon]|nr:endonuclease III [Candidatus Woesearchaeota archaeon]
MAANASKAKEIISALGKEYQNARISLNFSNPMQLLVSVMLSAQCTDKMVNIVTKGLFGKYKTSADFAGADLKALEQEIRPTGFYRNKARNVINAAKMIINDFNGKVPDTMESLLELPGVARKTANIVLSNAYGKLEGIAVDTHMRRVNYRLGLTKKTDPDKIEQDLMKIIPKRLWSSYTHLIIRHGRAVCKASVPHCSRCVLNGICPKEGVTKKV